MADAYFAALQEAPTGGRYVASAHTGGPWSDTLQHGGPPSALLVRAAERLAAHETARNDLVAVRYAAEFVGPVPVGEVSISAAVVRIARSAVLVRLSLAGAERPCLDARVWLVRTADTAAVAHPASPLELPAPGGAGLGLSFPYGESIEWRFERGSLVEPGPGVVWARPRLPLLAGEAMSGLAQACLLGDSASGISAELDWTAWTFLNIDLDVHLARPVDGDWIKLDAVTQLGGHGSALARSELADHHGPVGATAQTLVVAARPPGA